MGPAVSLSQLWLAMFLILLLMGLSVELHIQASAQLRKSRDIIEFFKKAGENAIKAISGLIPGGKTTSQLTTQPRGPKIPLNTINEDAIKPVIPYKRNMIGKLKTGRKKITNLDLVFKWKENRSGNKRVIETGKNPAKTRITTGKKPATNSN